MQVTLQKEKGECGLVIPIKFEDSLFLTIQGDVPSKKNSKSAFYNKSLGRNVIVSSSKFHKWHKDTLRTLQNELYGRKTLNDIKLLIFTLYPSTNRRYDLSNKFESIADLFVDAGLLEDDNADILKKVLLLSGGKDSSNPRAEVILIF